MKKSYAQVGFAVQYLERGELVVPGNKNKGILMESLQWTFLTLLAPKVKVSTCIHKSNRKG